MFSSRLSSAIRNFSSTAARRGLYGGSPGENLPFSMDNRYKLTALFMLFFGSGFGAPFLIVRYQMLKK